MFRAIARLRTSFAAITRVRSGTSWSCAVLMSAVVSFGKHEPPKPGPGCRSFAPIRFIKANPTRHILYVGPYPLGQIRHRNDVAENGPLPLGEDKKAAHAPSARDDLVMRPRSGNARVRA